MSNKLNEDTDKQIFMFIWKKEYEYKKTHNITKEEKNTLGGCTLLPIKVRKLVSFKTAWYRFSKRQNIP